MEKTLVPIDALHEWPENPRSIRNEDYLRLKKQIQQLGQYKPIIATKDGTVIGGNMRLKAYRDLGIKLIWVSYVEPKDKNQMLEYALSDNDRAGFYDDDMLANLIPNYDIDWSQYAVDMKPPEDIKKLIDRIAPVEEDEAPEVAEGEAISKVGEVYQLGRHRLMCGDSTDLKQVELLMRQQRADMVFTDPPYGVDYEGKTKDKLKIDNDKDTSVFYDVLINYAVVAKLGAPFYVCCPPGDNFKDFLLPFEQECNLSATIIWVKNSMVLGHGDYHYQHEPILYGWLKGATHKFYGDRTQTTVWQIDRPTQSKEHPTMKPIALMVKAIKNSSKEDDMVLDLFGGSGSTLIACEQTNRICYMMELDPKYCDVVRKRYAKFIDKEDEWQTITPLINTK